MKSFTDAERYKMAHRVVVTNEADRKPYTYLSSGQEAVVTDMRLKRIIEEVYKKRLARSRSRCPGLPPKPSLTERIDMVTRRLALEVLGGCRYYKPSGKWAGGRVEYNIFVNSAGSFPARAPATVSARAVVVKEFNGRWSGNSVMYNFALNRHWVSRVYMKGLAVHDGFFVVDAEETRLMVVKQVSRRFALWTVWVAR